MAVSKKAAGRKAAPEKKTPAKTAAKAATKSAAKSTPKAKKKPAAKPRVKAAPVRAGSAPGTPTREKLNAIKPSGGKDDSFFELVHEVARQIPRGRVTSYGAIAACLGTRMSARMVGWAMNACHLATQPVPAHRVVNRSGLLTGKHHFKPPEKMQQLLEKEGVIVKDDKVVDFSRLFWDPIKEL